MIVVYVILAIGAGCAFLAGVIQGLVAWLSADPDLQKKLRPIIIGCILLAIALIVASYYSSTSTQGTMVAPPTSTPISSIASPDSPDPSVPSSDASPTLSSTPGPYGGTLVVEDSLRDDGQQHYFQTNLGPNNDSCTLTQQGYQIAATNSFFNCDGADIFTDFVFQVTAQVGSGSSAGLIFRHSGGATAYLVTIDRNGCYGFNVGSNVRQKGVTSGHSSYQLILVAKGSIFTFYVDGKQISQFMDNSYKSGTIGLLVTGDCQNSTAETEATYTDASIWKL